MSKDDTAVIRAREKLRTAAQDLRDLQLGGNGCHAVAYLALRQAQGEFTEALIVHREAQDLPTTYGKRHAG